MKRALSLVAATVLAACGGGGGGSSGPATRTLNFDNEVSGRLAASDPVLMDRGPYHLYTFRGEAGQLVQVDVMSADFDAYGILQDGNGMEIKRDDDSGENMDAMLTHVLPTSGTYRVVASAFRAGAAGTYRVRVRNLGTVRTVPLGGTLQRGWIVQGRLTLSDQRLTDNSVYHSYMYNARAGETITVEVMSTEFDTYAIIQNAAGGQLAVDDDSGDGTNARLTFTFATGGTYRILANAYRSGSAGAYMLWVH